MLLSVKILSFLCEEISCHDYLLEGTTFSFALDQIEHALTLPAPLEHYQS